MKTYEVDFNINDSAASLAAFLNRITPFMNSIDGRESVPGCVDLTKCRYLGPDAAAILALLHHDARSRGLNASMRLPTGPEPLSAFCRYVGLSSMLGVASPPDEDHPSCETVQLRQWRGVPGLEGQRIVKLVRRHDTMHDDEAEYLTQAFNELVQNVDDHSKSEIGCVWCARYFAATREVRVAVGDRGRGILASLQTRHPEFKSSVGAMRAVLEGRKPYSARSLDSNMGMGLSNLRGIVEHRRGRLIVVSQDAIASFRHDRGIDAQVHRGMSFRGTLVCFTIQLGVPL